MRRIRNFVQTAMLGGLVVILPIVIMVVLVAWLASTVTQAIEPLTRTLIGGSGFPKALAHGLVIAATLLGCFLVGLFVKTRLGSWIIGGLERKVLKHAPGYSVVRETVVQLLGKEKSPFSTVALVQLFGSDTLVSAFVTDTHPDGSCTVFMPTGPNPTSGNIYHVKGKYVHPVDVSVEQAMRSIISCGAGSTPLIQALNERHGGPPAQIAGEGSPGRE